MLTKIFVKPGRAKPFLRGHPWVFSEAIARIEGSPAPGEQILLCDEKSQPIGRGLYNPDSQIRVRLFGSPDADLDDKNFWRQRLIQSLQLRSMLKLPQQNTNAYRLINAEGDGLSGLTVDALGDVLSVQCTSLGVAKRASMIFDLLQELITPKAIIEVTSTHQELEGIDVIPGVRRGALAEDEWQVTENGLSYWVSPLGGQKTGFYCDQRENRARVAAFARGKRLLDAYCFSGGFALNALQQGAAHATLVDASGKALSLAQRNLASNRYKANLIEDDALYFLERCEERFDVVVLDPPKFAKRAKDKPNALQGYKRVNAAGLRLVEPGGILASCSCSGLISEDDLLYALSEAAYEAKRVVSILSLSGAGADHPVRLPCTEGRYLKCVIARVT